MEKKIIYLPVKVERHRNHHIFDLTECEGSFIQNVAEESGYFFTTEQLNEYTAKVIKQTLETAAEKAECDHDFDGAHGCYYEVDKQSITNTFDDTFKKFEV